MLDAAFEKIERFVDWAWAPPFKGSFIFVWFVVLFAGLASGALRQWQLYDPDNYLYLVQAIDMLHGQSWFDPVQHRLNPPEGSYVHYSHILSGICAGIIFLLEGFVGTLRAALITAGLVPWLFLPIFLLSQRNMVEVVVDKAWVGLAHLLILFTPPLFYRFFPAELDHHGLEYALSVAAFGFLLRCILNPKETKCAVAAGGLLALGIAIALEILPCILVFSMCLGLWAVVEGGRAAWIGVAFSISLLVGGFGLLLMTRGVDQVFVPDVLTYSIVYVALFAAIAACFLSAALLANVRRIWLRALVSGAVTCLAGGAILLAFPALKAGPYGGMDAQLSKIIFSAAPESWPLLGRGVPFWRHTIMAVYPVTAVILALVMLWRAKKPELKWIWGFVSVLVAALLTLACLYQSRLIGFVYAFASLPIVAFIASEWTAKPATRRAMWGRGLRLAMVFVVLPMPLVPIQYGIDPRGDGAQQSIVQEHKVSDRCVSAPIMKILNDPEGFGHRPESIINTINEGAELLFRTPHSVLSAPYHMNVSGNVDSQRFFTTNDPEEARRIAGNRHARFVVVCLMPSQLLAYRRGEKDLNSNSDTFIGQLASGHVPDWLTPIEDKGSGRYRLYEIRQPPLAHP